MNEQQVIDGLLGFREMTQPNLSHLEVKSLGVILNGQGHAFPYLTFKESNVMLCPFKYLKSGNDVRPKDI